MNDIRRHKKRMHFIGIGGIGMSGIAEILMEQGHTVSGSDRELSDVTEYLQNKGAEIYQGHQKQYDSSVDFVVYSSAIKNDNAEMLEAEKHNIPVIRRAEMLGQLMRQKYGVAIAGTHGKTTTTSMIGHIFIDARLDPTIIVGGKLNNLKTNARLGAGEIFVTEADEYDRSFLALYPNVAVITNIEEDHLDIYKDLSDIKKTFVEFTKQISFDGVVIIGVDDENVRDIIKDIQQTTVSYGIEHEADYMARDIEATGNGIGFDLVKKGNFLGRINLQMPGLHNVKNALAASAATMDIGVDFEAVKIGLESFQGVARRFEIKGIVKDIVIVDDYAHHPTEVSVTIQGALKGWNKQVVAVFQPHLYSRTRDLYKDFAQALYTADEIIIMDVYPAREEAIPGIDGSLIADELIEMGHKGVIYIAEKSRLIDEVKKIIKNDSIVLFMGAGDITRFPGQLLKELKD
ncbi:UDP-N-acetylmuramate--L-alanine ligase [bacterium]|nr:UDP-N-acetylmuramate--L-alanine ligase [bacterium]